MKIEGHFDAAGGSYEGAQFVEVSLDGALLVAAEVALFQLLQGILDLLGLQLAMSEDNHARVGALGDV